MYNKIIEYIKADNIYYDKEGNYYIKDNDIYRYIITMKLIDKKE